MLLVFASISALIVYAEGSTIQVWVDGKQTQFGVDPIIENDTTLVPFRALFNELGLDVEWDQITKTVSGTNNDLHIQLVLDNKQASVNGNDTELSIAPKLINNSTYVPLRFVGEVTGADVTWDGKDRLITISTGNNHSTGTTLSGFSITVDHSSINETIETVDIFEEKIVSGTNIKNIQIEATSTDVKIIPTVKDDLKVTLSGEVNKEYEEVFDLNLKEMGDTLQIELIQKPIFFNNFNTDTVVFINRVDLYVEIPQKLYDSFDVKVSSGDIDAEQLQAKELILSTNSGDVAAHNAMVSNLTVVTSSGNIELTNSTVKTSVLEASSGNITISHEELKGDIKAITASGDITIDLEQENESLTIDFKTSSGDVDVKREGYLYEEKSEAQAIGKKGSGEYNIEARVSSGDITFK